MPNSDQKVVMIRPRPTEADRLNSQVEWLQQFVAMLDIDTADSKSVKRAAFAFVLEMDDGSLVVNTNGWADDQRAQQYFLQFMRNHGWPT